MGNVFKRFWKGITLRPEATDSTSTLGDLQSRSDLNKVTLHNGTSASPIVTEAHAATLTNKSINASTNTITNISSSSISSSAAISFSQLASLSPGNIILGNGSNVPTETTISGAITINGSGVASYSGVAPIANGGTGQTTASAGFNALSPMTTSGDIIYGDTGGTGTRLPKGTDGQILSLVSGLPAWTATGFGITPISQGGTGQSTKAAAFDALSPLTTKGDLISFGTTNDRLPVGTDDFILTSDSTQSLGLSWKVRKTSSERNINFQTGTTYTFALTDGSNNGDNPLVTFDNSSSVTATIPLNSSIAFPIGSQIDVLQLGSGLVEFSPDGGVTLNSFNSAVLMLGQFSQCSLIKTGTNTWDLFGDIATSIVATGGTITTDGDYKVHTFTSSGTFQVTNGVGFVESLVVAGGGGGGGNGSGGGGGGGGGGFTYTTPGAIYTVGSFTVTVGAGGAADTNGGNSVFDTITSTGGGYGATYSANGGNGGSGGGGAAQTSLTTTGGTGTVGQGNNGGTGGGTFSGGGGGGAGASGANGIASFGGNGGNGTSNSITGSAVTYAGGGGGGIAAGTPGTGGTGGGANGSTGATPSPATANLGGGGGGDSGAGGVGGSGVVILRYRFQ